MTAITASMVKDLRVKTDAPMMECKKALTEADGDMAKAEELLRVKLGSKANKAAGRVASEGLVVIQLSADEKVASILEINCETDFVAKNDDFLAFSDACAKLVIDQQPADISALSALTIDGKSVEDTRTALIGKIGENMTLRRFERVEAKGRFSSYIHGGSKIGVLLDLVGGDAQLGKDLAMHIAATKPKSLDRTGVPEQDIERERSVAKAKAAESGKPPEIVEKMVEGTIAKYLKEVTLLGQPFVKDDKLSVEKLLTQNKAEVASFTLYVVGEGIEKQTADFAAEVAAQAAAAGR
ncbi:MAG: translation elongation factor Ts [Burkholderiaceae bacterium]